jgi:hypothetical protein
VLRSSVAQPVFYTTRPAQRSAELLLRGYLQIITSGASLRVDRYQTNRSSTIRIIALNVHLYPHQPQRARGDALARVR